MKYILIAIALITIVTKVSAQQANDAENAIFIPDANQKAALADILSEYQAKFKGLMQNNTDVKKKSLLLKQAKVTRDSSIKAVIGEENFQVYQRQTFFSPKSIKEDKDRTKTRTNNLKKQLSLTANQTKAIEELFAGFETRKKDIVNKGQEPGVSRKEFEQEKLQLEKSLQKILSSEQYSKYKNLKH